MVHRTAGCWTSTTVHSVRLADYLWMTTPLSTHSTCCSIHSSWHQAGRKAAKAWSKHLLSWKHWQGARQRSDPLLCYTLRNPCLKRIARCTSKTPPFLAMQCTADSSAHQTTSAKFMTSGAAHAPVPPGNFVSPCTHLPFCVSSCCITCHSIDCQRTTPLLRSHSNWRHQARVASCRLGGTALGDPCPV